MHYFRLVQSVFQLIDQLERSMSAQREENSWSLDQCSFSQMTSSKRKITRRSRRPCSGGSSMMKVILNRASKTSRSYPTTIMSPTSLHLLTGSDPASKSLMSFQRISQRFSMRVSSNSIPTWFLKLLSFTRRSVWSMNLSRWSHHSSRHQCLPYRQRYSLRRWRSCLRQVWTCTIWTSSLPMRKLKWLNLQTSVQMRT